MERNSGIDASISPNTTLQVNDLTLQTGKHASRHITPKTSIFYKLLMPAKRFGKWLSHTVETQALSTRRIQVLNTLHPAEHVAYWLDNDLAFDRSKGLSLHYCELDPVKTEVNQLSVLKEASDAKSLSLLEKITARLGITSFEKQNQKDITHYLSSVISCATTPHALTHLYHKTWQTVQAGDISQHQFRQLCNTINKKLQTIIPAYCESLKEIDFTTLDLQEAREVLNLCYDLAITLKTAAPSLLNGRFPGSKSSMKDKLQETAIAAYKRTVVELHVYNDDEVEWYLNDSLSLMHDVLQPVLFATSDNPSLSLKKLQQRVSSKMRTLQSDNMAAYYRLYKQTKETSEAHSRHEQLQKKYRKLTRKLQLLSDDLALLKDARSELKQGYFNLEEQLETGLDRFDKEKKTHIRQRMKTIKRAARQITQGICNIHRKRQQICSALGNISLKADFNLKQNEHIFCPARHAFRQLCEARILDKFDIDAFDQCILRLAKEPHWSPEQADILLENYVKWVSMGLAPFEAQYYLEHVIEIYLAENGTSELEDILFDENDAILGYISNKVPSENNGGTAEG